MNLPPHSRAAEPAFEPMPASVPAASEASWSSVPVDQGLLGVLIVGAGFSGIGMAIRLRQEGRRDFVVCDKAAGVGGTWWANRYPGAACDVPSHLYSFSFAPKSDWSHRFSGQPEIRDYLIDCAHRHGLQPHLRLNTEIVRLKWLEERLHWEATTADGALLRARTVVMATGALSRPDEQPDIPGLSRFGGRMFHSQRWDERERFDGQRVGVIGTGASAVQFVPHLQRQAQQLTIFQRHPPWILPKPDRRFAGFEKSLLRWLPGWRLLARLALYLTAEARVLGFAFEPRLMLFHRMLALWWLRRQVADPAVRRVLTPDYKIGCKRILLSNDYYPAVAAENVRLVDASIVEIDRDGVRTADGAHHRLDTLGLGTGFKASAPFPQGLIFGAEGRDLMDVWRDGPQAYKGTTVSGFPNLFMLMGPNTGLGHSSMIYMIESQIAYAMDALRTMHAEGLRRIEVRPDRQDAYNDRLQTRMRRSVWHIGGCSSWYRHPVSGRNVVVWPGFTWAFRRQTRRFDRNAYHLSASD